MRELEKTYVTENPIPHEQHILQNQRKKRFLRRITLFLAFALTVIASLSITFYKQHVTITQQEAGVSQLNNEMNTLKDQEKQLQVQIQQLNNDDYIAKIARRDYFFSKDGEINFPVSK